MTMPPPPGQGGFPPGYGNQPDPGYQNGPGYPGGYPQYPSGPPGGGPQYPGGPSGPTYGAGGYGGTGGGYPGPPGPPPGGGRGPLILTVVGALVVIGGVVAALVFLLGDDKDKKGEAKQSGSPTATRSSTASKSPTGSPTPTETETTATRTPTRTPTATGRPTATGTGGQSVESVPLSVGECINLNTVTGNIDKVSCTTPHDMQVLKNFDMPGTTYPSDYEFEDEVSAQCDSVLSSTVAKEPNPNKYTLKYSYPKEGSWDRGDREVTCLVQDASEAKISKKLG